MKNGRNYSMAKVVFVIFTFIFSMVSVDVAFATNFKELIEGSEFLAKSKKDGKVIIELTEFKKGGFFKDGRVFMEGEYSGDYEIIGDEIAFWDKGGEKNKGTHFVLREKEDIIYLIYQGISIISLSQVPVGYQELREIQANNNAGKKRKVVSLSRKLLKNKKLDLKIGIEVSEILLQNEEFKLASQGFQRFGKEGRVFLCKVMEIAVTGSVPRGLDVLKTAKIAWDNNCENSPDLKFLIPRAEAIAYVCALAGEYKRAYNYQCQACQAVQRQQVLRAAEVKDSKIDASRLMDIAKQYKQSKRPESFKPSIL